MPVTDQQVAALRAFLTKDADTMAPMAYQLGDREIAGYQHLASAALSVLACRHFPHYTNADVVRYVASVRADRIADGDAYDFNPVVGENVMRYSLGKDISPQHAEERLQAVVALLDDLSGRDLSTLADVDELLADARALSDRWQQKES